MEDARALSELASNTVRVLKEDGVQPVLIRPLALAAHGYARHTTDIDLGVSMHPQEFARFAEQLAQTERVYADFDLADPGEPLGGGASISILKNPSTMMMSRARTIGSTCQLIHQRFKS